MIELQPHRLLIDGRPRLLLCGEIHYFRLARSDWQNRLDTLKAAGCDTVASYIPWLCHEPAEGQLDLDGHSRPELDLGAFIDLCQANGLQFLARPGPFVMAEMKNEGLPFWLYEHHPEIVPVGWDRQPATTRTVDVLAPAFLAAARRWYAAVLARLAPRLHSRGGNVIALQLDNEVGMLSWVSNTPELTDGTLADFADWLARRYPDADRRQRYPFDLHDPDARASAIRSPQENWAPALLRDLGHYQRDRYARYLATLRDWAKAAGITGIPFVINVHGTGGGRGFTFPVGISQLYETWAHDDYLVGSDLYLGNLTPDNFQDLYLCNALLQASLPGQQVLCSVEFECGDGDYGSMQGNRYDPSAVDLKTRMSIAQGNRLLNYYLFAGGFNYRLDPPPGDGDDRIAITGERHGVAAPIKPEGDLSYTFPRMARIIRMMAALSDTLAGMDEEHDGLSYGFIPDYFMTEARYPGSDAMRTICANLEANRTYGAWESMVRALLLAGFRFGATDLQREPLSPATTPRLILPSARYMDRALQHRLADWLVDGGRLLLFGEVPIFDMEGRDCTVLATALGIRVTGTRQASLEHLLSLRAEGWAAPRAETRTHFAQTLDPGQGRVLLRLHDSGAAAAVDVDAGRGRAILLTTAYPCDIDLFRSALQHLGAVPEFQHDCPHTGLFLTSTANAQGERFLHVINLDGFDKTFRLYQHGACLLDGESLQLPGREGLMVPLGLRVGATRIRYASAEWIGGNEEMLYFRTVQPHALIVLETDRHCQAGEGFAVEREGRITRVRVAQPMEQLALRLT